MFDIITSKQFKNIKNIKKNIYFFLKKYKKQFKTIQKYKKILI